MMNFSKSPNFSLFSLLSLFLFLLPIFPLKAADVRLFENPIRYGGRNTNLWVDACVVEYGNVNCSDWARWESAHAFCQGEGYERATSWRKINEADEGHSTWRLMFLVRNGVHVKEWHVCEGCYSRLYNIECLRN